MWKGNRYTQFTEENKISTPSTIKSPRVGHNESFFITKRGKVIPIDQNTLYNIYIINAHKEGFFSLFELPIFKPRGSKSQNRGKRRKGMTKGEEKFNTPKPVVFTC